MLKWNHQRQPGAVLIEENIPSVSKQVMNNEKLNLQQVMGPGENKYL